MLSTFQECVKTVKADLYRCRRAAGLKGFLHTYWAKAGFRYTFWMRIASYLHNKRFIKLLYWIVAGHQRRLGLKYGISISPATEIGPGLFIGHCGGIVVNERASIGRNCNLSHGVTIGQKNRGKYKGCPTIGDSVYIGSGACIIGGVSVGSNVAIGAHAVVVRSIGDNEVVVGNPARTVSRSGATDYVNYTIADDGTESERSHYELERAP